MPAPQRLATALAAACALSAAASAATARGPDCLVIGPGAQEEIESTQGCNASPVVFQTVLCGIPFHGTSCFDPNMGLRDTDWLKVILPEPGTITVTFRSEFEGIMGFVGGAGGPLPMEPNFCEQISQINPFVSSDGDCQPLQITATVQAGTYVLFVSAMFTDGTRVCGSASTDYVLEVTATTACGGDCNGNGTADDLEIAASPNLDCFRPDGNFNAGSDGVIDACQCRADWNGSGSPNSSDISHYLTSWLCGVQCGGAVADIDCNGATNSMDISLFLSLWLDQVTGNDPLADCP